MLVQETLLHHLYAGHEHLSMKGHHGDLLKDDGVVHGIKGIFAPAERAVILNEDGGDVVGVQMCLFKALDGDNACIVLIGVLDFLFRHITCTWNFTVVVVCVRRPIGTHTTPCLCE